MYNIRIYFPSDAQNEFFHIILSNGFCGSYCCIWHLSFVLYMVSTSPSNYKID